MPLIIPYPSFTPGTTIFSAQANNNNAAIAAWANAHELLSTGVHGVTGTIVGTGSTNNFTGVNTFISGNLRIFSSATPAFYLGLAVSSSYTANRTLTIATGDSSRTITLGGDLTTSGAFSLTFTTTAATNITLPTTGTLATLAGIETLTNKTLSSPAMSGTVTGSHAYSDQILLSSSTTPTANYSTRWGDARLWGRISQAGSILSSYNITSVIRYGTGDYSITPSTSFAPPISSNNVINIFPYSFGYGGSGVWVSANSASGLSYLILDGASAYDAPHNVVAFGVQ